MAALFKVSLRKSAVTILMTAKTTKVIYSKKGTAYQELTFEVTSKVTSTAQPGCVPTLQADNKCVNTLTFKQC